MRKRMAKFASVRKWLRRSQPGQALVEAAVTAPIMFLLLMGAAELARLAYAAIEVSNAARAGAQYASQEVSNMGDTQGITLAVQDDAANLIAMGSSVSATETYSYSCSNGSTYNAGLSGGIGTCSVEPPGVPIPNVTVTVNGTFNPMVHIPGLLGSFSLKSSATETCIDCP